MSNLNLNDASADVAELTPNGRDERSLRHRSTFLQTTSANAQQAIQVPQTLPLAERQATMASLKSSTAQQVRQSGKVYARLDRISRMYSRITGHSSQAAQTPNLMVASAQRSNTVTDLLSGVSPSLHKKKPQVVSPRSSQPIQPLQQQTGTNGIADEAQPVLTEEREATLNIKTVASRRPQNVQTGRQQFGVMETPMNEAEMPHSYFSPRRHNLSKSSSTRNKDSFDTRRQHSGSELAANSIEESKQTEARQTYHPSAHSSLQPSLQPTLSQQPQAYRQNASYLPKAQGLRPGQGHPSVQGPNKPLAMTNSPSHDFHFSDERLDEQMLLRTQQCQQKLQTPVLIQKRLVHHQQSTEGNGLAVSPDGVGVGDFGHTSSVYQATVTRPFQIQSSQETGSRETGSRGVWTKEREIEGDSISPRLTILDKNSAREVAKQSPNRQGTLPQNLDSKLSSFERARSVQNTEKQAQSASPADNFYVSQAALSGSGSAAGGHGHNPNERSPQFKSSRAQDGGGGQRVITEMRDLQEKLIEDQACIIKQGDQTFTVDANLIRMLRNLQLQEASQAQASQAATSQPSPQTAAMVHSPAFESAITPKVDSAVGHQPGFTPATLIQDSAKKASAEAAEGQRKNLTRQDGHQISFADQQLSSARLESFSLDSKGHLANQGASIVSISGAVALDETNKEMMPIDDNNRLSKDSGRTQAIFSDKIFDEKSQIEHIGLPTINLKKNLSALAPVDNTKHHHYLRKGTDISRTTESIQQQVFKTPSATKQKQSEPVQPDAQDDIEFSVFSQAGEDAADNIDLYTATKFVKSKDSEISNIRRPSLLSNGYSEQKIFDSFKTPASGGGSLLKRESSQKEQAVTDVQKDDSYEELLRQMQMDIEDSDLPPKVTAVSPLPQFVPPPPTTAPTLGSLFGAPVSVPVPVPSVPVKINNLFVPPVPGKPSISITTAFTQGKSRNDPPSQKLPTSSSDLLNPNDIKRTDKTKEGVEQGVLTSARNTVRDSARESPTGTPNVVLTDVPPPSRDESLTVESNSASPDRDSRRKSFTKMKSEDDCYKTQHHASGNSPLDSSSYIRKQRLDSKPFDRDGQKLSLLQQSRISEQDFGNTLYKINEEASIESTTMRDVVVDDESISMSNQTYGQHMAHNQRHGLLGKSSEFNVGDMRHKNVRLCYLDPNTNNLYYAEDAPPTDSGNPVIDQIANFAYSHGVDPRMFCEREQNEADKAINQLSNELKPRQPRSKSKSKGGGVRGKKTPFEKSAQGQEEPVRHYSITEMLSQEIVQIRSMLHDAHPLQLVSPSAASTPPHFLNETTYDVYKQSSDLIAPGMANNARQRRQSARNTNMPNAIQFQPMLPQPTATPTTNVKSEILTMLRDETVKNKTQIAVLSIALNRYLNTQDRQKVNQINRQIRILEQHELKVQEIMNMFRVFKKELHFAFLFASPIVVQKCDNAFKYFPMLNFNKEFVKIRDSINAAQVQINITKRQCTTDSLQEVLAQKPLGLHFSGHGILNNLEMGRDFYERNKGQGDFLVLENDKGGSELVSREQLKKMIKQNKCELEFVFVATCHSEFVGHIFQQAGAKHVICIKHSQQVRDDAVITFTDTFYSMLFEQNKEICNAFSQAQLSVEISYSPEEANIFKLLLREDVQEDGTGRNSQNSAHRGGAANTPASGTNFVDQVDLSMRSSSRPLRHPGKLHTCSTFGPFQKGRFNYVAHQTVHLTNKAPKMPNLRGRQKDMFRVLDKILNSKTSRLFNLIGWGGMGKSALVASMLDYISERGLLKGGSIYFNARNISMCELFIRNFNQVLLSENPTLFGVAKERDQNKHEPILTLNSILSKISIIDGDIVLVIDNAEEIICNERNDFAMLVSMMLTRVSQLKILLTSRRALQRTLSFKEEEIFLSNLSNIQSANLFKEVMARELDQGEINALLRTQPDFRNYPDEQHKWEYKALHEHHLFTLLNGNPQSIILVGSLLADPQKKLTLQRVYTMLTDDQLFQLLEEEGIEEDMQVSLHLSAQLSFQAIEESDPESVDLLYLLGLLPGGISPNDLDFLWGKVGRQNRKFHMEAKNHGAAGPNGQATGATYGQEISGNVSTRSKAGGGAVQVGSGKGQSIELLGAKQRSTWRRALAELKKGKLAEEQIASRRGYNTSNEAKIKRTPTGSSEQIHDDTEEEDAEHDLVIILPKIVRSFTEGRISEQTQEFFLEILSQWYNDKLHTIFVQNENIVYQANHSRRRKDKHRNQVARDFESLEENLNIYIHCMHEKHQETKYAATAGIRRDKRKQQLPDDTSDTSSLYSEDSEDGSNSDEAELTMAEKMFAQGATRMNAMSLPKTGTPDTFRQYSEVAAMQSQLPTKLKQNKTKSTPGVGGKRANNSTPSGGDRSKTPTSNPRLSQDYDMVSTNYPELKEAFLAVNERRPALERYIDAMKPKKMKHPSEFTDDRQEKALQYWRWAFEKVKAHEKEKRRKDFQKANLNMIGGENLEESFDSDQSQTHNFDKVQPSFQRRLTQKAELCRIGTRRKLKEQLQTQPTLIPMNFQRGSIKDPKAGPMGGAYSRQLSRYSVYEQRRNTQLARGTDRGELKMDEKPMLYFLVNLILIQQFNVANSLVKKHYIPMKKCSQIFKANVRRFQALSLYRMYLCESQPKRAKLSASEKYSRMQKLDRSLKRAEKHFHRAGKCAWGLGLTYFQQANMLLYQIELEESKRREAEKAAAAIPAGQNQPQLLIRKNLSLNRARSGMIKSTEQLAEQAKGIFLQAEEQFKKVNHWRGLYRTYRLLEQTVSLIIDYSTNALNESGAGGDPKLLARERDHYNDLYKKCLDYYDIQRYSDRVKTDLTIQRSGGDDYSLMTEVVTHKHNTKLFEDAGVLDSDYSDSDGDSDEDSFHTDDLSQVDEISSQYHRMKSPTPTIEVLGVALDDNDAGPDDERTGTVRMSLSKQQQLVDAGKGDSSTSQLTISGKRSGDNLGDDLGQSQSDISPGMAYLTTPGTSNQVLMVPTQQNSRAVGKTVSGQVQASFKRRENIVMSKKNKNLTTP